MLFADIDVAHLPLWVQILGFFAGSTLTGVLVVAGNAYVRYREEKRRGQDHDHDLKDRDQAFRAGEAELDKSVAAHWRKACVEERERRGEDYAFYIKDREEWTKREQQYQSDIGELREQNAECEKNAAVQDAQLKFQQSEMLQLKTQVHQQKLYMEYLGRVIGELREYIRTKGHEMPLTDEYQVPEELRLPPHAPEVKG